MKVRSAIRRLCKHCQLVRRKKRRYIVCKRNARHKQRQGMATFAPSTQATFVPKPATSMLCPPNASAMDLSAVRRAVVQWRIGVRGL